MVSQGMDRVVTPAARALECIRFEACDPRSDNRRRIVDVGPEAVTIRRAVAGVSMAIRVASSAYRGVALRIVDLVDGRFRYEVRLAHRDPDLSVMLAQGEDLEAVEAKWREWIAFLKLPALAGRAESIDVSVNVDGVDLTRRTPNSRRRGSPLAARRPRFLRRRKVGRSQAARPADRDPVILFYGWRIDR
jgi:hypothetical protein